MTRRRFSTIVLVAMLVVFVPNTWAMKKRVLYYFTGPPDGKLPAATLISDTFGNLYGSTVGGGTYGRGTVFELASNEDGSWTETVLYSFTSGTDGSYPQGRLVLANTGKLYGTTQYAGAGMCVPSGCGTVFELTPDQDGSWSEKVIYNFRGGTDGANPAAGVILDSFGNLYGTAADYGTYGQGAVFELTPNQDGTWQEVTLYSFKGGKAGGLPQAPLIFDTAGNLYGTAFGSGNCTSGCGVVFKLSPNGNGSWTGSLLHAFKGGRDGMEPALGTGLTFDSLGRLYGATRRGGVPTCGNGGCGVVFRLTSTPSGPWKENILHRFQSAKGWWPNSDLAFDAAGNLYGTTQNNGFYMHGTVFRLSPNGSGGVAYTTLHTFNGQDGYTPFGGVLVDAAGNLYFTTGAGGPDLAGGIFEISP